MFFCVILCCAVTICVFHVLSFILLSSYVSYFVLLFPTVSSCFLLCLPCPPLYSVFCCVLHCPYVSSTLLRSHVTSVLLCPFDTSCVLIYPHFYYCVLLCSHVSLCLLMCPHVTFCFLLFYTFICPSFLLVSSALLCPYVLSCPPMCCHIGSLMFHHMSSFVILCYYMS